MRWPWRRPEGGCNGERAARERREAQQRLEQARRQQPEVERVARALSRRRDEFARLIDEALRGA